MTEIPASPPGQSRSADERASSPPPEERYEAPVVRPPDFSAPAGVQNFEPPQDAAIVPVASGGNHPALQFDWQPVNIDSNRTCSCAVSAAAGHALSVSIEQPPYHRTLRGAGSVKVAVIPAAPLGTRGRLIAKDETSGAAAEFTWEWKPGKASRWVNPSTPAARSAGIAESEEAQAADAQPSSPSAGAATFFGVPSQGRRFAFLLDVSGSMKGTRWESCVRRLGAAFEGLAPESEIFVVLFSDRLAQPPRQAGWTAARPEWTKAVFEWASRFVPDGGTVPRPAFNLAFSLPQRPDVIYFLTDGIFSDPAPSDLRKLCLSGDPPESGLVRKLMDTFFPVDEKERPLATVINTITLDDKSGAAVCRKIAEAAGGKYVHASSNENP